MIMKWITTATFICMSLSSCSQSNSNNVKAGQQVGGRCEGCEAIYETPIPFDQLDHIDTLPDFKR